MTVGEALDHLRAHPPAGRVLYLYVVDAEGRLEGVVPIRRLLLSPPERPLADIMVRKVITLPAEATVLEACEFFIQHRLLAIPVVDETRRVLGIVDVELYTGEITQLGEVSQEGDLFQRIGVRLESMRGAKPLGAFRHRFPWLGCNLAAGTIAALLSGVYEKLLGEVVALAFFIPVVLNLAESVSSQSVSLTLQLLHGRPPSWSELVGKVRDEALTGSMLGLASGAVMAAIALAWLRLPLVSVCLLGGIAGGVTGAAVLGVLLPILLRWMRLEPRVAAGPMALAGADIITILLYLALASWLLGK
jgi:magnesium transporter